MKYLSLGLALVLLNVGILSGYAQEVSESTMDDQEKVEVTVYNSNIALVKDRRKISLTTGKAELRFMDVAAHIKPETVHIKELTSPDNFKVLEQNYEYDLINYSKLLDKYVGKNVKLVDYNRFQDRKDIIDAKLISNNGNMPIYEIDGEIHLGYQGRQILPEIPDNLIAKPTLTWLVDNQVGRSTNLEVSYLTNSVGWKADYVLVVNSADTKGSLSGWVTVNNNSGTTYTDAKLKLVAGDVNRVQERNRGRRVVMKSVMSEMAQSDGFVEDSFFEYHIYDLQRPTTIKNNQNKQVNLLNADGFTIKKQFLVRGNDYYYYRRHDQEVKADVNVYILFENAKTNKLGMPLPMGTVRLYKEDKVKSLQFIGEDRIDHTPKDERVRLLVGKAFDVVVERTQTDYQKISTRVYESEWEVSLRNHKKEPIVVTLEEPMHSDWTVISENYKHTKKDAFTAQYNVPVGADEEVVLRYRIRVNN